MKRKIVCCSLISSLLFSIGCYNNQSITKEQLNETTKEELRSGSDQSDLTIFTKDSSEYKFQKGNYQISSESMKGFGTHTIAGRDTLFQGYIPMGDITSLETTEFSLTNTIVVILAPVLVAAFVDALVQSIQHHFSRY